MKLIRTATALFLTAAACQGALIRTLESASVTSRKVTLGDLAVIEAGPSQRAQLASVVVAFVPLGRSSIEVDSETVQAALIGAGVNMAATAVRGATRTRVVLDGAPGGAPLIISAVERYLAGAESSSRFTVSRVSTDFKEPEKFVPVVTAARPRLESGRVRFDVADASAPSVTVGHVFATLSKALRVVIARRRLTGGRIITAADLETRYLPAADAAGCVTDAENLIGRRMLHSVAEGQPVPEGAIEGKTLIKRGDEVRLAVGSGPMSVSIRTVALESGSAGDVVRLKRLRGRGEFIAKVTGAGSASPIDGGAR